MMLVLLRRRALLAGSAIFFAQLAVTAAYADPASDPAAGPKPTPSTATPTIPPAKNDLAEGSDIVITGTRPNELAPVTVSLNAIQPQAVVSRSFIEDSLPATADFNQIALITPSVTNFGGVNGVGLSESKAQIRGFQDGEYNITYDGIPFGDTNDPTHHSNTFFPSNTIETLVVDRGPGNASQLGQATFGGNINLFSRETRERPGVEVKGTYGTWNTELLRGVIQSGSQFGGTEMVASGQYTHTNGARTYSPFTSYNVFGKVLIPLGPNVKFTLLGTYNSNRFNQPDKDGATLSQVAQFGKNFSLNNDPTSQTYWGYNHTHKTTDFEIGRLDVNFGRGITLENRLYSYSYDNETLSGNDVTLYATATPAQIATANMVVLTPGGAKVFGVPGYTKTNKYRVWGDTPKLRFDFGMGTLTVGAFYEHSNTYRQQRDVDLITMSPNFAEKPIDLTKLPPGNVQPPANIKFDQHSHITNIQEFAELELRPLPGLSITPGYKHVSFKREINAAYNQTTRIPQQISKTYKADLPFLTVNYSATPRLSFYGEYARGFLTPPLSVLYVGRPDLSTVEPQRSTNYQAGAVYHGRQFSVDADVYYIDFKNKFASFPSPNPGEGVIFINQGKVIYKGVEGQVTYSPVRSLALFVNGSVNYAKTNNAGAPYTQVANAPVGTAAGGVIFRDGPIRASLIDKYTAHQWAVDGEAAAYRIPAYNTANISATYDLGKIRFGVEVSDLFDSTKVVNINPGKSVPFDQYFYQPGRAIIGDLTLRY